MKIYLDRDFCCHTGYGPGLRETETDCFEGCCDDYIEGYRLIPEGESWLSPDGRVFHGEMLSPVEDMDLLKAVRRRYLKDLREIDLRDKLIELLGTSTEEALKVFRDNLETIL